MKSVIQGLLIAFIGTLTIFALTKKNIFEKNPISLRFLEDNKIDKIRESFCSKSSPDLQNFYKNQSPFYHYDVESGSEVVKKIITDFVSKDPSKKQDIGTDEIKKYFSESPLYIFVLIVFILLVLLWIPYTLCIWCKCCACIPVSCLKRPKLFVSVCLLFCAIVLVNCFIGYTENGSIVDGVFGLGCSILKVEQHLKDGDENELYKPRWIGINGIARKLNETIENLTSLDETANKLRDIDNQNQTEKFMPPLDNFLFLLQKEYNESKEIKINNPNPHNETEITPDYLINKYGPPEKENTTLYYIYKIFENITFEGINEFLDNFAKILELAHKEIQNNNGTIDELGNIRDNLANKINDIENSISDKIFDYDDKFDQVSSKSRKYINVFFSINLFIVIIVGIALVFLLLCGKGLFLLCVSWFFMYILMLLTFFLSAVFGLIGSFAQEASYAVYYVSNHLNEVKNVDKKVLEISDICLNGNGSLSSSSIVPTDFDFNEIDKYYKFDFDSNFDNATQNLTINKTYLNTSVDKLYDQILVSIYNLPELEPILNNVKTYTTNFKKENKDVSDIWVINQLLECGQYKYITPNGTDDQGNQFCLVISEWNSESISERYDSVSKKDDILDYFNSIISYLESYKNIIEGMKEENKPFFINQSDNISKSEIEITKKYIKKVLDPFVTSYYDIVGENSIFDILNCNFLKRDVNRIMEELYEEFGKTFQDTSTLLLVISIFELGMSFLVLFIMKGFKHLKSKESLEIEKSESED